MSIHYFSTTLLIIVTEINPVNWFEIKELLFVGVFFSGGGGGLKSFSYSLLHG